MPNSGTTRKKFPWFPTINYDLCRADLECLNFCLQDVYEWDKSTGRPVVANPYNCVPGCDSCAENCAAQAIRLPGKREVQGALRKLRADVHKSASRKSIVKMRLRISPKSAK